MFADTLDACGLNATSGAYLDQVPAVTLSLSSAVSMFSVHRRLLGAAMGHLAHSRRPAHYLRVERR